jgi:hypothetical protein
MHSLAHYALFGDQAPEDIAISAGLGVVGLMQHTRAVTPAIAATDDAAGASRRRRVARRVGSAQASLRLLSGVSRGTMGRRFQAGG